MKREPMLLTYDDGFFPELFWDETADRPGCVFFPPAWRRLNETMRLDALQDWIAALNVEYEHILTRGKR